LARARGLRLSRERLWRDEIDLMLYHSLVNVDVTVPLMRRSQTERAWPR
jgi:diketogulonate reductase-like aldo/keto reductase